MITTDPSAGDGQMKRPRLQPLGVERHAQPVVPEYLDQVAALSTEGENIARVRIALQRLLDLQRQSSCHGACPCAGRDPDPHS